MLPSGWNPKTIEETCEILDYLRVPVNETERQKRVGSVPYYGANGLQGYIDKPIFNEKLLLLAEDGGHFEEFSTRPIAYRIDGPSWVNNHAHILRNKKNYDLDFIFYSLQHRNILPNISGGTRGKLTQGELKTITLEMPQAETEQRAIARLLDAVDEAIEATSAMLAKQEKIKQGLLQDLLTRGVDEKGHLRPTHAEAPNLYHLTPLGWLPKGWEVEPLSRLIKSLDAGVSVNSDDRQKGVGEVGILKTSCVTSGMFDPHQHKSVVANEISRVTTPVYGNSILISRMNTPLLVGENAYVDDDYPDLFVPDRLWITRMNEDAQTNVRWLSFVLQTKKIRDEISNLATGTSGSMKNLTKASLLGIRIGVPSPKEQNKITDILVSDFNSQQALSSELAKLCALKAGLMQDLLTGKKRVTPALMQQIQQAA